jgi:hypothetical protein
MHRFERSLAADLDESEQSGQGQAHQLLAAASSVDVSARAPRALARDDAQRYALSLLLCDRAAFAPHRVRVPACCRARCDVVGPARAGRRPRGGASDLYATPPPLSGRRDLGTCIIARAVRTGGSSLGHSSSNRAPPTTSSEASP